MAKKGLLRMVLGLLVVNEDGFDEVDDGPLLSNDGQPVQDDHVYFKIIFGQVLGAMF